MPRSIIAEGKTTAEAIEKGLKELKVNKSGVDIKVLEEEKRSFFSILAPRVVKVELTVKEDKQLHKKEEKSKPEIKREKREIPREDLEKALQQVKEFLKEFVPELPTQEVSYEVEQKEDSVFVNMHGETLNYLIGYRGETLEAMQVILTSVASRGLKNKVHVVLDIENYRAKRKKALEDLAEKIARTVMKTGKSITLEPMNPYERKIIHSKLQNHKSVKTYSTGVEPRRKVVIALK